MAFLIHTFALALLSVLALSSEVNPRCEELIKPLDMEGNYSSIMGKWFLVEGTSEGIVGMIIQTMETLWMELSPGSNNKTIHMKGAYRLDHSCRFESMDLPYNGTLHHLGIDQKVHYYLLPSCPTCLIAYYADYYQDTTSRVLLLFSRERGAPEATRDLYRKQAGCLKFPPLITTYNVDSELCPLENEAEAKEN
ncbi:hypothetical protein HF521_018233 [Silurus meridionalis]|uniref:Apolipoprotein M n=1 Tax=Silurus meridionalis TaxID=175797 RepID=A0A8T0BJ75_SILME|nr:hypothetical protein HF521_018233 [Silurus meridionalis]